MENLGFLKNRWQYRERRRYLRVPGGKWRCHAKEKRRTRDKQTKLAFSVDLERESRVRERVCMKRFILLIQIIKLYKIKKNKKKRVHRMVRCGCTNRRKKYFFSVFFVFIASQLIIWPIISYHVTEQGYFCLLVEMCIR